MKKRNKHIRISICILVALFIVNTASAINREGEDDLRLFSNQALLDPIFEKLYLLEKNRAWKINIVHVGDSHIQADFLTNFIRETLQTQFGNGGYGFTFPYSLMRTNGTDYVRYTSNAVWKSRLNVSPVSQLVNIGLSGIGLYTNSENFAVQLNTNKDKPFNSIKVLYSTEIPQYQLSLSEESVTITAAVNQEEKDGVRQEVVNHYIKRGESLSLIAAHYNTTVLALKVENDLRSNLIQAGRILRIPTVTNVVRSGRRVVKESSNILNVKNYPYYSSYISSQPLNRVSILSRREVANHDINGFVIENDKPGLVYHGIGVNGAKLSDFNKYPLFFKQLRVLQPDLVILSFGTNESYQRLSVHQYITRLKEMIALIKKENPYTEVLVMTPPPSMLRRRISNVLVGEYSNALMGIHNLPVWDLYARMEGESGITGNGKYVNAIARDKIHYTFNGYRIQGQMFSDDFLKAYNQYKKRREN